MASYTGMSNLQNHPHRSGFDIGRKNAFTAKVGELLPVYWDISMPGDKYKFNVEYFTRTQPVETSAYTRLREYRKKLPGLHRISKPYFGVFKNTLNSRVF
jgi:hypothetical protein